MCKKKYLRYMTKPKGRLNFINECYGWDCVNWSQSINYFFLKHIDFNKIEQAL